MIDQAGGIKAHGRRTEEEKKTSHKERKENMTHKKK